ncbi:MAG: hypothetical protein V4726_23830 [Verrucomicrobiota bacterium]
MKRRERRGGDKLLRLTIYLDSGWNYRQDKEAVVFTITPGFENSGNHPPHTIMNDDNRISAALPEEDIKDILSAIQAIRAKLPFLVSLTAQQRKEMPKMRDRSAAFDDKCTTYMASNPELVPGFVDVAEVAKDRALRDRIMEFQPQLQLLSELVDSTLMVVNSEVWMADLTFYQSAREAARRNRIGAETIYNDLRLRFPGTPAVPEGDAAKSPKA